MLQMGSIVNCVDNTGVIKVKVIQVLGYGVIRHAKIGDRVVVSVVKLNNKAIFLSDERKRKRFKKGSLHRGIILHTKSRFFRKDQTILWFKENALVLVDKNGVPIAKKINVGIPREVVSKYPGIASLCFKIF